MLKKINLYISILSHIISHVIFGLVIKRCFLSLLFKKEIYSPQGVAN